MARHKGKLKPELLADPCEALPSHIDPDEVIGLDIEFQDLCLVIYLVNSGIQRIKEISTSRAPDVHDQKTIKYGQEMLQLLCDEYRAITGNNEKKVAV